MGRMRYHTITLIGYMDLKTCMDRGDRWPLTALLTAAPAPCKASAHPLDKPRIHQCGLEWNLRGFCWAPDCSPQSSEKINYNPSGSMQLYGMHLGLQVVPMSLPLGLCMYYIGTWTHWE